MNPVLSIQAAALTGIAILALLVVIRTWRSCNPSFQDESNNVLFVFVGSNAFIFMLIPSVLRFFLSWESDLSLHLDPMEIVEVYIIELVSIIVWAFSLHAMLRRNVGKSQIRSLEMLPVARTFLSILLLCAMFMNIDSVAHGSALLDSGSVPGASTLLSDRILWPISVICMPAGSVVGCYVMARGRRFCGTLLWLLGIAGVAVYVFTLGLRGVRGALIWPALWAAFLLRMYRPRTWLLAAVPALVVVGSVVVYQESYVELRKADANETLSERVEVLQKGASAQSPGMLSSAEFRLGSASRYSVAFVRMWDTGRGAYLDPIINSLYAPMPRLFYPNKPWPTSRDGDRESSGMYIIVSELSESETHSMTEFLTGAHSYWEFGWAGVVAIAAITAVYSKLVLMVGNWLASAGPPMIVYFFRPWGYNNPRLWISDAILAVVQIVPAIIVVWVAAYVWNLLWSQFRAVIRERTT